MAVSPMESEHETVEPTADAEEADAVAGLQEAAFVGDGGGDREGDGADVAEELVGAKLTLLGDAECAEDGLLMGGADLVANHFVDAVGGPSHFGQEGLPDEESFSPLTTCAF